MLVMESQGSLNLNDHTHQVASSLSFRSPLEKSVFLFLWEGPVLWLNIPLEGAVLGWLFQLLACILSFSTSFF